MLEYKKMFAPVLSSGFVHKIHERCLEVIKEDRARYNKIYECIESYIIKHKLIRSDVYALLGDQISSLTDEAIKKNIKWDMVQENSYNKHYEVYAQNTFKHANNLCNAVYLTTKNITAQLKTEVPEKEYMLLYDTRAICYVHCLQYHKHIDTFEILQPIEISGFYYLPPEIEIIDIYHKLYSPDEYEMWDKYTIVSDILFKQVDARKEKKIFGGKQPYLNINILHQALIDVFLKNNKDCVLLGNYGGQMLLNHKKNKSDSYSMSWGDKIQICTISSPEKMFSMLQEFIKNKSGMEITMREQDLNIPKDVRTKRYTCYIKIPDQQREQAFFDIFNIAQFELVPYCIINEIRVASYFVLMRFLFIDMWIIRIILRLGKIPKPMGITKITLLWNTISALRKEFGNKDSDITDYIGIYRKYTIDKKLLKLEMESHFPYYPAQYEKKKGQLRIFEDKHKK